MTLTTDHNRVSYIASGFSNLFPYTFTVFSADEILVYVNDAVQSPVSFTVSNLGQAGGGNVQLAATPAAGARVDLLRSTHRTQEVNFIEGDKLPPEDLETALDKAYSAIQDLDEQMTRAFKIPPTGAGATTEPVIPQLTTLAGQVLKVNAAGTGLEGVTVNASDIVTPITTQGDLIRGSVLGTAERLGLGTAGQLLTVVSGQAAWANPSSEGIPLSILHAKGDLIVATEPQVATWKPAVSGGAVLTTDETSEDGLRWVVGAGLHGRARLRVDSATQISLMPYNGNSIYVQGPSGWRLRSLPSFGLSASNTFTVINGAGGSDLAANTLYLVTITDRGDGTLALDFRSTLTHEVDPNFGVEIATGNPQCTVVGLIRTNASAQFVDTETQRFLLNWFNRRRRSGTSSFTTSRTASGSTFAEPHTEIRVQFLTWADEAVAMSANGSRSLTSGDSSTTGIAIDGTTTPNALSAGAGGLSPITVTWAGTLADGYHFATLLSATDLFGVVTYHGVDSAGQTAKCRLFVNYNG